jgi:xanthine dehydrogenase accessory factor
VRFSRRAARRVTYPPVVAELDRIRETITDWAHRDIPFALATVVGVRGSTYRGLAARQLMAEDGTSVGTVSGGCLDSDLRSIAARVIRSATPEVVEFDLTADDEAVWGWGIGCNGATRLLVEPPSSALALSTMLGEVRRAQRPAAIVHLIGGERVGERVVVTHAGVDGVVPARLADSAREALIDSRHRLTVVDGAEALIEVVGSPSRLVVCGAGHDAVPLVRYGADLGFEVIVVDDRRQFLTAERFPEASALVHCEPRDLGSAVELDQRSHVVLMSHNYLRDLEYLRCLSGRGVAYVGALGPGERLERLLADLGEEYTDLGTVYGPAGLDIGAEGPGEIALAIVAEIVGVRRGKKGGHLRVRKGPRSLQTLP